jgi:hypothetical protein
MASITLLIGTPGPSQNANTSQFGHASVMLKNDAGEVTFIGLGPNAPSQFFGRSWTTANYDIISVGPGGTFDPTLLNSHPYAIAEGSEYGGTKSYTFAVTDLDIQNAWEAAAAYEVKYENYNGFTATVCTDFALTLLSAAGISPPMFTVGGYPVGDRQIGSFYGYPAILPNELITDMDLRYTADKVDPVYKEFNGRGGQQQSNFVSSTPKCFLAGAPILMAGGSTKPIERIAIGDLVMAFDPLADKGRGALRAKRVTRLFSNVTDSVFNLRGMQITPGHVLLDAQGHWRTIEQILATDSRTVLADGSVQEITAERIDYSQSTAHLFEQVERVVYPTDGGLAMAPKIERGWRTYNFEVEDFHTYVAGGIRVHNDSVSDYAGFLAELGVPSGQLTQVAYDGIVAEFGQDTATLVAYGGPAGIKSLQDQIAQYRELAAKAHDAGDYQSEAAFNGQVASLGDALTSATGALNGAIDSLAQQGHTNVAQYLLQDSQQVGALGVAGTTVTLPDGTKVTYGADQFATSEVYNNGDGTTTTVLFGRNASGDETQIGAITKDSAGNALATTIYSANAQGALVDTTTYANGSTDQATYGTDAQGNRYLQSVVERGSTGAIVSTMSSTPDGSTVTIDYLNGQPSSGIATDASGVTTKDIAFNPDGSATVALLDDTGFVMGSQTLNASGEMTSQTFYDENGVLLTETYDTSGNATGLQDAQGLSLSSITGALGSSIGNFLGGNSLVAHVGYSTLLGTAGGEIMNLLSSGGSLSTAITAFAADGTTIADSALTAGAASLGDSQFLGTLENGIGSGLSSLLIGEAAHALGLNGIGAVLFNAVGGSLANSLTTTIVKNVLNSSTMLTPTSLFAGVDPTKLLGGVATSLGGALGSYLSNLLVPATSLGGTVGGSLGSSLGSLVGPVAIAAAAAEVTGTEVGGTIGSVILPGIGSFIGALVGGLVGTAIGNFVDPSKPLSVSVVMGITPVTVNGVTQMGFAPVASGAWGGNTTNQISAIQDQWAYGNAIGAIANVVDPLAWMTGGTMTGLGGTGEVTFQQYGTNVITTTAAGTWDWISCYGVNNAAWERAVNEDAISSLEYADISGGDPIMTAALAAATRLDNDIASIATDMQVAKDYETYLANTTLINEVIAANPDSAFAAGWIATLARVEELGLNKIDTAAGLTATLTVDGGGNAHEAITNAAGVLQEDVYFNRDGTQKDYQYYVNEVATAAFQTINLPDGGTAMSSQIGTQINAGSHSTVTSTGDYGSVAVAGDGTTATISGASASISVAGNGDIVNAGTGVSVTIKGGAIVTQQSVSEALVYSYGFYVPVASVGTTSIDETDVLNGSGDSVTIGDGSLIKINGANNTIAIGANDTISVVGSSDTINVGGAGNTLTISSGQINFAANASATVTGNSDAITLANGASATVTGNSETFVLASNDTLSATGTSDAVTINGTGNTVTASGAVVTFGSTAGATVTGNSNTFSLASNDDVTVSGTPGAITVNGSGNLLHVTGAAVGLAANASANVIGDSNTFTVAAGSNLTASGNNESVVAAAGANVTVTGGVVQSVITGWVYWYGYLLPIYGTQDLSNRVTLSGGGVSIGSGSTATVTGSGDAITVASNDSVTVNGTGENMTVTGTGSTVAIASSTISFTAGASATINGAGDTINVNGAGASVAVTGATVNLTAGASATVTGASNVYALASNAALTVVGSPATIGVNGTGDTVSASSGTITLASGASAAVTGNSNAITLATGANLTATGASITITAVAGDIIALGASSSATIAASSDTISIAANSAATVNGSNDTINVTGTGVSLTTSSNAITLASGASATVAGNSDAITLASNTALTVSGSADTITINGVGSTVSATGEVVNFGSGASATVAGNSNAISLSTNDVLTVSGTPGSIVVNGMGNSIIATSSTIQVATNASASATGDSNTISGANGSNATLNGANGVVTAGTNATISVVGNNATINAGAGSTVNSTGGYTTTGIIGWYWWWPIYGTYDYSNRITLSGGTVNIGAGSTATITGSSDVITIAGASTVTVNGTGDAITLTGAGSTLNASSDAVSLSTNATATVVGNSNTYALASNDTLTVSGTPGTITINGTSDNVTVTGATVNFGSNASATVTGNSETFNLASNDTLTTSGTSETVNVNGAGDVVNATAATINVAANASASVSGNSDTITVGAGASLTAAGNSETVNGAAGSTLNVTGGGIFITSWVDSLGNVSAGANQPAPYYVTQGSAYWGYYSTYVTWSPVTSNQTNVINASGSRITIGAGSLASINGTGDTITIGPNANVTAPGANDAFVFHNGFGKDTVSGFGATDSIQFDSANFANWATVLGDAKQSGSDTVITLDAADTVTLKNVAVSSLNQNQFHFV